MNSFTPPAWAFVLCLAGPVFLHGQTNRDGLRLNLDISGSFLDRSTAGPFTNPMPALPLGPVFPDSRLGTWTTLGFSWITNGEAVVSGALYFEKKNRLSDRVLPTDDSVFRGAQTLEMRRDFASWNALGDPGLNQVQDLFLDRLSARGLGFVDEISLGSRLRADWGSTLFKRDFQGLYAMKDLSLIPAWGARLKVEGLASVLFEKQALSTAQSGKWVVNEDAFLFGGRARLTAFSNDRLEVHVAGALLRQGRVFPVASPVEKPKLRTLYVKIRSTAAFDRNNPASSSYPVLLAQSPGGLAFLDRQGNVVATRDVSPTDERDLVGGSSFMVYRAVTRSSERSGSEFILTSASKIVGNSFYDQYTNGSIYRQCNELNAGAGDFYRGEIVYGFPLSQEGIDTARIKSVRLRLKLNYNYTYAVSADGVTWKEIETARLLAVDPMAHRRDLGNGSLLEVSDPYGLYDNYWAGTHPGPDLSVTPPFRTTGFDLDLDELDLLKSRDVAGASVEVVLPFFGSRLSYSLTRLSDQYYQDRAVTRMAHDFHGQLDLPKARLKVQLDESWVEEGFSTGFAPLGSMPGFRDGLENSLVEDRDSLPVQGGLALADNRRGYLPGLLLPPGPVDRLNLAVPMFKDEILEDLNGNGFDDRYENDLRPDMPLRAGLGGTQFKATWSPLTNLDLTLLSRHQEGTGVTNALHYGKVTWTFGGFFLQARGGMARDDERDDLMWQVFNQDAPTNVARSGVWALDPQIRKDLLFGRLGAGIDWNGRFGASNGAPGLVVEHRLWARVEGSLEKSRGLSRSLMTFQTEDEISAPVTFTNPWLAFTPRLSGQVKVTAPVGEPAEFLGNGAVHLVKHLGPVDITVGGGLARMSMASLAPSLSYGVLLAALTFKKGPVKGTLAWQRAANLENLSRTLDQWNGEVSVHTEF